MIFPSYIFLLVFLPAVLLVWYGIRSVTARLIFLVGASYVFYGWWDYRFTLLMFATTWLDYVCGAKIYHAPNIKNRKFWMGVSLAGNLGSLAYFKYMNFFTSSVADGLAYLGADVSMPTLNIILPLGISFYTFQSMSYTLDIYRRECPPCKSLLRFSAYVSMFPQLVAGPIVRYSEVEEQIATLSTRKTTGQQAGDGVWLFVIGLVKKVVIADSLAPMVDYAFGHSGGIQVAGAWVAVLCYTCQLYFDFSAYSDMARGLGKMLGFDFCINFNSPYKSKSISEFWGRWHISLSHWLRDNLFVPLGGSRHGTKKTLRNLGIVMFLGGLWHGAAWTFVIWGLFHGFALILHNFWTRVTRLRIPTIPAMLLTFVVVMIGWTVFRADSMTSALNIFTGMLGMNGVEPMTYRTSIGLYLPNVMAYAGGLRNLVILPCALGIIFFAPNSEQLPKPRNVMAAIMLALAMLFVLTQVAKPLPFLYFTF